MNDKYYALLAITGLLIAYAFIGVSIALAPWFSWYDNALSDLGNSVQSKVASIFNFGLLLASFFVIVNTVMVFRKYVQYTSICLTTSAFLLQLVATFNEVYGFLHYTVSIMFFISIGITSIVYAAEKKSYLSVIIFVMGLSSWILYWMRIYSSGVAIPEIISSIAVSSLLILLNFRIILSKDTDR